MIVVVICWLVGNCFFVLLLFLMLVGFGIFFLKNILVDVLFDLFDIQVIVKMFYLG